MVARGRCTAERGIIVSRYIYDAGSSTFTLTGTTSSTVRHSSGYSTYCNVGNIQRADTIQNVSPSSSCGSTFRLS